MINTSSKNCENESDVLQTEGIFSISADISNPKELHKFFQEITARFGDVDILSADAKRVEAFRPFLKKETTIVLTNSGKILKPNQLRA